MLFPSTQIWHYEHRILREISNGSASTECVTLKFTISDSKFRYVFNVPVQKRKQKYNIKDAFPRYIMCVIFAFFPFDDSERIMSQCHNSTLHSVDVCSLPARMVHLSRSRNLNRRTDVITIDISVSLSTISFLSSKAFRVESVQTYVQQCQKQILIGYEIELSAIHEVAVTCIVQRSQHAQNEKPVHKDLYSDHMNLTLNGVSLPAS